MRGLVCVYIFCQELNGFKPLVIVPERGDVGILVNSRTVREVLGVRRTLYFGDDTVCVDHLVWSGGFYRTTRSSRVYRISAELVKRELVKLVFFVKPVRGYCTLRTFLEDSFVKYVLQSKGSGLVLVDTEFVTSDFTSHLGVRVGGYTLVNYGRRGQVLVVLTKRFHSYAREVCSRLHTVVCR